IRSFRAGLLLLVAGAAIALICYLRFGVPALADNPDIARSEFIQHLSPFSYYQWLLMEVGIALAAFSLSRDTGVLTRRRRVLLVCASCLVLILIAGVSSRVTLGTPIVTAAIIWWTGHRRIPWVALAVGLCIAVAVVG